MFDDCALRDAFRLAAENGRLAARDPQSVTSLVRWRLEKSPNFPRNEPPNPAKYFSERPEITTQSREVKEGQNKKEIRIMNNIKRISLMTATFLTVALVSSAVEAE